MNLACGNTNTRQPLSSFSVLPVSLKSKRCPYRPSRAFASTRCSPACFAVSQAVSQQESLQSWAQQRVKQLPNCRIGIQQGSLVLLTSTSAQAGQTLLSVPEPSWISLQTVQKSAIGSSVASLEPWLQIALFILFGLSDQDSEWSEYLLSLPSSLDVPLLWDEQELDLLEGSQLLSTVQGYR